MAMSVAFVCIFALSMQPFVKSDSFLQKSSGDNTTLLTSLEAVFGPGSLKQRADALEGMLRPMFQSLPKQTSHDRISHAAARYALHRIMLDRHGWSINGLEPNATTFNITSLVGSGMLKDIVPVHVENIFEDYIGPDGFSLADLAILAGTIELLVHADQKQVLMKVCELFDFPVLGDMGEENMRTLVMYYKAVFLVAASKHVAFDTITANQLRKYMTAAERGYPGWKDTVLFLDDERQSLAFGERNQANPFIKPESSLHVALRVVERVADDFARRIADPECHEIKDDLLDFERGDTGRIRLADFYRAGLDTRFYFLETKEYLQAVGALDTSDIFVGPKVIVSNYVLAKSNCLANENTYGICCLNECEALYGQLEHDVSAADSAPDHISRLVSRMSTSTVHGPRNLSSQLKLRLEEIADGNAGRVLIHSRLFAQWMHQAFPRECPYPHLAGTTTSLNPDEWVEHHGIPYRIDINAQNVRTATYKEAMNREIESLEEEFTATEADVPVDAADTELMWTNEEEHFVTPTQSITERLRSSLCTVFGMLVLVSAAVYAKTRGPVLQKQKGFLSDSVFV